MLFRLFTVPAILLATLGSAATLAPRDENACQRVCCDALVQSTSRGLVGINCNRGGIDCGFSGQIFACCAAIVPVGAKDGTGIKCQRGN
ncbi:hypothetical protein BB8028_0004g00690 [Beauveria bassiana]|uniref:Hydrophobin n=1 Tax=Beauveria bassiana TaxID=176275 RepID=A0A2S7YAD3_BEABA|nr:hypothetical protein BB8028_0004g00690 [Beauveria bassiana]